METLTEDRLKQFDERLARVEMGVEKVRRYLFWGLVAQLGLVLLPIIAAMIILPFLLSGLGEAYQGLL
jgi:hypothetical protein